MHLGENPQGSGGQPARAELGQGPTRWVTSGSKPFPDQVPHLERGALTTCTSKFINGYTPQRSAYVEISGKSQLNIMKLLLLGSILNAELRNGRTWGPCQSQPTGKPTAIFRNSVVPLVRCPVKTLFLYCQEFSVYSLRKPLFYPVKAKQMKEL